MKKIIKWIIGLLFIVILISKIPSFLVNIFWSESNAPWEKVNAYYYPDRNNLTEWKSNLNVGSVEACRDWVAEVSTTYGDQNLQKGDYECAVACKNNGSLNICRLTVE